MVLLKYLLELVDPDLDISKLPADAIGPLDSLLDMMGVLIGLILFVMLLYATYYLAQLVKKIMERKKGVKKKKKEKKEAKKDEKSDENEDSDDNEEETQKEEKKSSTASMGSKELEQMKKFMSETKEQLRKHERDIKFLKTQLILNSNVSIDETPKKDNNDSS